LIRVFLFIVHKNVCDIRQHQHQQTTTRRQVDSVYQFHNDQVRFDRQNRQQENAEHLTRSIKTSEKTKRQKSREHVNRNEFDQGYREQKNL
jgi:hypothetical protein